MLHTLDDDGKPVDCGQSQPWSEHADELARWTLVRLVNRSDAWGYYRSDGPLTRYGTLSHALLVRHYKATVPSEIVGLHSADADNLGRWIGIDIDQHGSDGVRAKANETAAFYWFAKLTRLGFHPLLTNSNGAGGYHLRVLLSDCVDASRLHHFVRQVVADYRTVGLTAPPETFPKQPDVRRCPKKLGNWLRLPGRHHKRHYYSEIWNGARWLRGNEGIDHILSLNGDDPALIPDVPPPTPTPRFTPRRHYADDNLSRRVAAYMARLPNLAEGQGRDDVAFLFASFLVRDLQIADNYALDWLRRWDAGNSPPKGDKRLIEIIANAHAHGSRPYGCGLPPADAPRYDRKGNRVLRATKEVR